MFSFIVPVFNVEKYLNKCIDSLLNQDFNQFEIILIYDKSDDSSLDICRYYASRYGNIFLHFGQNLGCGAARNIGIKKAASKYLIFVDSDDWISPNLLKDSAQFINCKDFDFLNFGYDFRSEFESNNILKRNMKFKVSELYGVEIFKDAMLDLNINSVPWNKIYNRDFLLKYNIYFPVVKEWEDVLFTRIVSYYANKTIFMSGSYYHALVRNGSRSRNINLDFFKNGLSLLKLEEDFIRGTNNLNLYQNYYIAHCIKILNFFLIKSAFQYNSFSDFFEIFRYVTNSKFYNISSFLIVFRLLRIKSIIMFFITLNPYFCWYFIKIINTFKIYKPY